MKVAQVAQFELPCSTESICSHSLWIWDPENIFWELMVLVRSKEIHLRLLIYSYYLTKKHWNLTSIPCFLASDETDHPGFRLRYLVCELLKDKSFSANAIPIAYSSMYCPATAEHERLSDGEQNIPEK